MIAEIDLNDVVAAKVDTLWFKDPEQIKAFLLDQFCNNRIRLHLKTAGFWKFLIENFIAADEVARYTPPNRDTSFEAWLPICLAAGGYGCLEPRPVTTRLAAEIFGLPKNAAKVQIRRIRQRSEAFFARGGEYIPAQRTLESEVIKISDPLRYSLDRPLRTGRKQWKNPLYKMVQASPELSSHIIISGLGGDGVRNDSEVDVLDKTIPYDFSKLNKSIARLPCPLPLGRAGAWEYPDFTDEFWTFTREYEGEHAYRGALQSCMAEMAGKRYAELCAANSKHNPSQLEGRSVIQTLDVYHSAVYTSTATRASQVDAVPVKEHFSAKEAKEPISRGFTITLKRCGLHWKINHSRLGSGVILKVNGAIVCCRFTTGRANLTVSSVKSKTGIDLKKTFALHEAMARITAHRKTAAENGESPFSSVPPFFNIAEPEPKRNYENA